MGIDTNSRQEKNFLFKEFLKFINKINMLKVISQWDIRLALVIIFILIFFITVCYRIFNIQVLKHEKYSNHVDKVVHTTFGEKYWVRGLITDRAGTPLVVSSQLPSIFIDPLGFVGASFYPELGKPCFMSRKSFKKWQINKGVTQDQRGMCDRLFFETKLLMQKAQDDKKLGAQIASKVFPNVSILSEELSIDAYKLMQRLMDFAFQNRRFMYIKRQVPDSIASKILSDPKFYELGVRSITESTRLYPYQDFAPQILGFTDVDGQGIEGIERRFDMELHGKIIKAQVPRDTFSHLLFPDGVPTINFEGVGNVVLTIDSRLQKKVEKILETQVKYFRANFGIAVIMDSQTGEILALANTPVFNPMERAKIPPTLRRNRAIVDAYELGSVMKPLTLLRAIDLGIVRPNDRVRLDFKYVDKKDGKLWNLRDHKFEHAVDISVPDIIIYSSNKGIAKVALLLGKHALYSWFRTLGFGSKTGIEFPGESTGILHPLREWYTDQILATNAFGHGTSITVMQLLYAYTLFANKGSLVKPHLVRYVINDKGEIMECLSPASCKKKVPKKRVVRHVSSVKALLDMMQKVVSKGTARNIKLLPKLGYLVAGKTGTAYKVEDGVYSLFRKRNTFIGLVSPNNPRLIGVVVLDEPKHPDSKDEKSQFDAGGSSAVVFDKIMVEAVKYLGIAPDEHKSVTALNKRVFYKNKVADPYIPPLPQPTKSIMPNLVGKTLGAALDFLSDQNIDCKIYGSGIVIRQYPEPGGPLKGCELYLEPLEGANIKDDGAIHLEPQIQHRESPVPKNGFDW